MTDFFNMKIIFNNLSDYVQTEDNIYLVSKKAICEIWALFQVQAVFWYVLIKARPHRGCLCSFFLSALGHCSHVTDIPYDASHANSFCLSAVQESVSGEM